MTDGKNKSELVIALGGSMTKNLRVYSEKWFERPAVTNPKVWQSQRSPTDLTFNFSL